MQRGSARSAFRRPMNASRVAASLTWLNSSSNWSTTSSSRCAGGSAARTAAIAAAGSSRRAAEDAGELLDRGRAGAHGQDAPGAAGEIPRVVELRQQPGRDQRRLARSRRADHGRKWCWRTSVKSVWISSSRPWKKRASSLRNGTMPGYGQATASITGAGRSSWRAEPGGLLVPPGPVGAVERLAEAEPQGGLAGVQGQGQETFRPSSTRGERDEPLAELRPAVGQERRAEHQQRESAGRHRPLELVRDRLAQPEVARGETRGPVPGPGSA